MKLRINRLCCVMVAACFLSGCGSVADGGNAATEPVTLAESTVTLAADTEVSNTEVSNTEASNNDTSNGDVSSSEEATKATAEVVSNKVLVAYFTRLPNTESGDDLDVVVQGGGPYGAIGSDFASANMDAISSASITVLPDTVMGNVETVATWIANYTEADLFSIETVDKYPVNYDAVIDQGGVEQRENYRPQLSTHIENIDEYSVIYIGYPNWYNDMPMALYTFLEEYDFTGKTIVPFATSAGSGLANTISTIARLQPGANVIETGLSVHMRDVKNSETVVINWIDGLGITP